MTGERVWNHLYDAPHAEGDHAAAENKKRVLSAPKFLQLVAAAGGAYAGAEEGLRRLRGSRGRMAAHFLPAGRAEPGAVGKLASAVNTEHG